MAKKKRAKVKAKKRVVKRPKVKRIKAKRSRKPIKKTAGRAKKAAPTDGLKKIGEVTHYFPKVKAAAVLILKDSLKVGDVVYIKGHTTDFKEKVGSIQLDHSPVERGLKGQEIGLLVKFRVRTGDNVYKL